MEERREGREGLGIGAGERASRRAKEPKIIDFLIDQ